MIELEDDIRQKYIDEETEIIRKQISGFSVREEEICQAAFYRARERWEADQTFLREFQKKKLYLLKGLCHETN